MALERCVTQRIFSVPIFTENKQTNKPTPKKQNNPKKPQTNKQLSAQKKAATTTKAYLQNSCWRGTFRQNDCCKEQRLSKTQFAALPVCKSTSPFQGRGESFARLWQPEVAQRCFIFLLVFKCMCRKTGLKSQKEIPASTSLLPSPHFHQC